MIPNANSSSNMCIWSPASGSPGASSDGNSHVGGGLGYTGGSGSSASPYMSAVAAHVAQSSPYAMSNNSQLSGGNYSQNYSSHSYFGTMEASYLPSVPFHAATAGHGTGMGDMSMVGQQAHGHAAHHHSASQSHGGSHQFMSQSYPYHHHPGSVNNYPSTSECVDYSKDSTWKFQVL